MSILLDFYRAKHNPPADPTTSFVGKTVIVTGSNTGLGLEAARKFHALGAEVVLGVRNVAKGEVAKESIVASTGKDAALIRVWQVDMESYDSVKAFATRASIELAHLDVALLNAGVSVKDWVTIKESGLESTFHINTTATVLLGVLLLPKLRQSGGTLTFTSSGNHTRVDPSVIVTEGGVLAHVSEKAWFSPQKNYGVSKLLLEYGAHNIARKAGSGVVVNTVCPGACKSDLPRQYTGFAFRIALSLFALVQRTTEEGARALVSATALGQESHGRFWTNDKLDSPLGPAVESELGKQLESKVWDELLAEMRRVAPEVDGILA